MVLLYGMIINSPLGTLGSIVGFAASFLTSTALWSTRHDGHEKKFHKWILQGMVVKFLALKKSFKLLPTYFIIF